MEENGLLKIIALGTSILIAGCSEYQYTADQCMRQELFKTCMSALPEGPKSTHYNDWDEVVSTCDQVSYRQSIRLKSSIKEGCI